MFKKAIELIRVKSLLPIIGGILIGGIIVGGLSFIFLEKKEKSDTAKEVYTEINKKGFLSSILFGGNKVELNYEASRPKSAVERFSMESGEKWLGNSFWDRSSAFEGSSSLGVSASKREPSVTYYEFDVVRNFSEAKFVDFYLKVSDVSAVESLSIKLAGKNKESFYYYNITNLAKEWNFIRIPIKQFYRQSQDSSFNLSAISQVRFEVVSRPESFVLLNIDQLIIENDDSFIDDWNTVKSDELSLDKKDGRVHLLMRSLAANDLATMSSLPGVKDFVYSLKISPQTPSRIGLFFRGDFKSGLGYYFLIDGKDSNSWQLKKLSQSKAQWADLAKGEIANVTFKAEKFYWLKVEANKDLIVLSISLDGKKYNELVSLKDDEYLKGGIGIAIWDKGFGLFDEFKYEAK